MRRAFCMLKKAVLICFFLLLVGCSKSPTLSSEQIAAVFADDFTCSVKIISGDDVFCADVAKSRDKMTFCVTCPEDMSGLSATIDGENISFEFLGIKAEFSANALPEKAPAKLFYNAVNILSLPDRISLAEEEFRIIAYGDGFSAELDKGEFLPQKITVPEQSTVFEIKNFKITEKN